MQEEQSSRQHRWRTSLVVVVVLLLAAFSAACQPLVAPEDGMSEAPAESEADTSADDASADDDASGTNFAYVGTYTRGAPGGWSDAAEANPPTGISAFAFDPETGDMTLIQTVPSENPSFLTLHPSQQYLYAINEIADYEGGETGSVEAYAINEDGTLTLINRQSTGGSIPAHLSVDPTGSYLVIGNYVGGNFVSLPIGEDGSLGEVISTVEQSGSGPHERQTAPHPHAVVFDPSGQYIATADLGTDQIQIFQLEDGQLIQVDETTVAPGSGPRHVSFSPAGDVLYVINELTGTVTAIQFDAEAGELGEEIQNIGTVPEDFPEHKSTAEIMVHPSGRFLYGSNRKFEDHELADSIVAYSIDPDTGELTLIGHTAENIQFPRGFNFDPTGTWLYALNQKGDSIIQLAIDPDTGELTPTGVVIEAPVPVSIVFVTES